MNIFTQTCHLKSTKQINFQLERLLILTGIRIIQIVINCLLVLLHNFEN